MGLGKGNGRGGARPGSGPKRKAVKHVTAIQAAEGQIKAKFPTIIGKLLELAEQGDRAACEYLVNRIWGKPVSTIKIKDADGQPRPTADECRQLIRRHHRDQAGRFAEGNGFGRDA